MFGCTETGTSSADGNRPSSTTSERRRRPSISTANGSSTARIIAAPRSAPTKPAGRITIEIQTLTPSVNATTSANVRHLLSVTGSATRLRMYRGPCYEARRMRRIVVTIDGPAGAGKSTVAKQLARRLGYRLLDTGAIYRAVALTSQRSGIPWTDANACAQVARDLDIRFDFVGDKNHVFLADEDVSAA